MNGAHLARLAHLGFSDVILHALLTTSFILRFWGRMARRVGSISWWCMWFVLLGFEMARKFFGLTR
jgi:hypothetical protein